MASSGFLFGSSFLLLCSIVFSSMVSSPPAFYPSPLFSIFSIFIIPFAFSSLPLPVFPLSPLFCLQLYLFFHPLDILVLYLTFHFSSLCSTAFSPLTSFLYLLFSYSIFSFCCFSFPLCFFFVLPFFQFCISFLFHAIFSSHSTSASPPPLATSPSLLILLFTLPLLLVIVFLVRVLVLVFPRR